MNNQEILKDEQKMNKIEFLISCKIAGFEVVKSNSGQIALNNKENTMPFVLNNDIGYLTPQPHIWFDIDDEIKRIKEE